MSQNATSSLEAAANDAGVSKAAESTTGAHGGRRKLPFAFTEHGTLQAAKILMEKSGV
jgi:hypothetical protein